MNTFSCLVFDPSVCIFTVDRFKVEKNNPELADDTALSTMWMVYRANGVVNGGTRIYVRAFKANPHRLDFAELAFCGHVRENAYPKQGQLARKLCKDFEENKYFFWSVCSMATMAWDNSLGAGDMQLELAEKMMSKSLKEGTVKQERRALTVIATLTLTLNRYKP